jgi:AcrR family transcriptional regulator
MSPLYPEAAPRIRRSAGRPRSETARLAILDAAYEALLHAPVSEVTTLQIAKEAGVSTATVYRWWPNKEALLLSAFLDRINSELPPNLTGKPLEALRQHVRNTARFFLSENGPVVVRLLSALQDHAALRDEFFRNVLTPQEEEFLPLIRAAQTAGELPLSLDAGGFLDAVLGPLLARLLAGREAVSEEFALATFDYFVAGARALGQQAEKAGTEGQANRDQGAEISS